MKQQTTLSYVRQDVRSMSPYQAVASPWESTDEKIKEIIKLDAGENPYGCSPAVLKKLRAFTLYNRYPDTEYNGLRNAISTYTETKPSSIMVGNGSDELLDIVLRTILNENDEIINCPPTFGMYEILIRVNKGVAVSIPRLKNFTIDIEGIQNAITPKTKAIILCSPNNPTGNVTPIKDIKTLLETNILTIVDEAYFEFSTQTALSLLSRFPNLIILRTLSKWAGLAGLRLGYLVANPLMIKECIKIKSPYNVNIAAVLAGRTILENPQSSLRSVKKIISERERVSRLLTKDSRFIVYPSETNSLFIRINDPTYRLVPFLTKNQIFIRSYKDSGTTTAIRLTIGTPTQNNIFLTYLKKFFALTKIDSIIFDMDGVLIDNNAYEQAIMRSVQRAVENNTVSQAICRAYINVVKSVSGFNNDWDTTFAIVTLIKKKMPLPQIATVLRPLNSKQRNSVIYKNLKDIFQSYYLGADLFEKTYNKKPPVSMKKGLITQETCLIDKAVLDQLQKRYKLAIATSRPKMEALFAIQNAKLTVYFPQNTIVAREDVTLEKPAPEPLLTAQKRLQSVSSIYIGDTINDVLAAKKANMPSIVVGKKTKGNFSVENINNIMEVLL